MEKTTRRKKKMANDRGLASGPVVTSELGDLCVFQSIVN